MPPTRKTRDSNIELLRIAAMFLVLMVHANFLAVGAPTAADIVAAPVDGSVRVLVQSLSICCVNAFVMISGWFGIRPKWRGAGSLIFQSLFYAVGIYAVFVATGLAPLTPDGALTSLTLDDYWFVKAYLLLYLLAPVLNAFADKASRRQLGRFLIGFFAFEFLYGWLFPGATGYLAQGYSPLAFMGLYLLARYVNLHRPHWAGLAARHDFAIAAAIVVGVTALYVVPPLAGIPHTGAGGRCLSYLSPTTIVLSLFLLLGFSKLRLRSRFANWLGASSFAIYLIHTHQCLGDHYIALCRHLRALFPGTSYWAALLPILAGIFLASVLIDQLRLRAWKRLWAWVEKRRAG